MTRYDTLGPGSMWAMTRYDTGLIFTPKKRIIHKIGVATCHRVSYRVISCPGIKSDPFMTRVIRVKWNIKAIHWDMIYIFSFRYRYKVYISKSFLMIRDGSGINQRSPFLNHPPHSKEVHFYTIPHIQRCSQINGMGNIQYCFVDSQKVQVCPGAIPKRLRKQDSTTRLISQVGLVGPSVQPRPLGSLVGIDRAAWTAAWRGHEPAWVAFWVPYRGFQMWLGRYMYIYPQVSRDRANVASCLYVSSGVMGPFIKDLNILDQR